MVDKIMFDMDGVLVDFEGGVRDLLGIEPKPLGTYSKEWDDQMFEKMAKTPDFYLHLEPIQESIKLFKELRSLYGDKVEVLTGVPKPERNIPTASDNKKDWIKRYLGDDVVVHTVLRRDKKNFVTGKKSFLIDDYDQNVNAWNKAGGTGILFTNADDCRKLLRELKIL